MDNLKLTKEELEGKTQEELINIVLSMESELNKYKTKEKKEIYTEKISELTDQELFEEAKEKIKQSFRCADDVNSEYHWQVKVLYEYIKYNRHLGIYNNAYKKAMNP